MNKVLTPSSPSRWHSQFWGWFVFGLPAIVVVASIATLVIAIRHSDNLVVDDYYKEGLAINRYLDQDRYALAHQISASLSLSTPADLQIEIDGNLEQLPDHLLLQWEHPTTKNLDFQTALVRHDQQHYAATLETLPTGRWYLTLKEIATTGEDSLWRLKAQIVIEANGSNAPEFSAQQFFLQTR
ncbi:FixH family protein [Spongiibacter sp. KMU-158]|uniref:FixH family protein n=1 Tax=Spongiibacter pelagi TaxID=2760804 RepID=A0A927GV22_9GAMM|nr:FixH family protein [Spongiibacter pelagi]MBD2858211.1 FixH family protein [Spongiibacter pelagi]